MADAGRDEPPFEGGSQPVKQMPPHVPPSRPAMGPALVIGFVVILVAAVLIYIFFR